MINRITDYLKTITKFKLKKIYLLLTILSILFLKLNAQTFINTQNNTLKIEQKHINRTHINKKTESNDSIKKFLLNPFNLYEFKKKVGQSNSGGGDKKTYYYRLNKKGMYYSFFIFSKGNGYIYLGNKKRVTEIHNVMGLEITTYKTYGKYKKEYLDPTEELIEVRASLNNYDLPELAFIGLNITEIKKHFGEESFIKENCLVYTFKDRALVLGLNEGVVKWLKYVHLNTTLTKDKLIKGLYVE